MKTKTKPHYYFTKRQILDMLKKETVSMRPDDIESLSKIFSYLTFADLKRISKVVNVISKGRY